MSWGVQATGSRAGVAREIAKQFDQVLANLKENDPERDDLVACKDRVLKLIDLVKFGASAGVEYNAVKVQANGSHSWDSDKSDAAVTNASFSVSVQRLAHSL